MRACGLHGLGFVDFTRYPRFHPVHASSALLWRPPRPRPRPSQAGRRRRPTPNAGFTAPPAHCGPATALACAAGIMEGLDGSHLQEGGVSPPSGRLSHADAGRCRKRTKAGKREAPPPFRLARQYQAISWPLWLPRAPAAVPSTCGMGARVSVPVRRRSRGAGGHPLHASARARCRHGTETSPAVHRLLPCPAGVYTADITYEDLKARFTMVGAGVGCLGRACFDTGRRYRPARAAPRLLWATAANQWLPAGAGCGLVEVRG